jgi:hypothetical protein
VGVASEVVLGEGAVVVGTDSVEPAVVPPAPAALGDCSWAAGEASSDPPRAATIPNPARKKAGTSATTVHRDRSLRTAPSLVVVPLPEGRFKA